MKTLAIAVCSAGLFASAASYPVVNAQAPRAPAPVSADVSAQLLAEVKALRADLAESSRAGLRAQLLMARLQLQEQRIIHLDRRRTDVTAAAAEAREKATAMTTALAQLEAVTRGDRPKDMPRGDLEQFEREVGQQLTVMRNAAKDAAANEERLRNEAVDLEAALAAEQGRWNDFNSRLDDLERAMLPR